jgi:hypothetical protein
MSNQMKSFRSEQLIANNINSSIEFELSNNELEIIAGGTGPCRQCYDPDGKGCTIETQRTSNYN